MISFGMVGTNFVSDWFAEAVREHPLAEVSAVYSRTKEKGQAFADRHGISQVVTSLDELADSGIEAVYIASPTSFHCAQSTFFLKKGIAVFCEKPLASNEKEARQLERVAKENGTLLMEGLKNLFEPRMAAIQKTLPRVGKLRRITAGRSQYSSRYDHYKEGVVENAFKPEFSNGAAMDLGIYVIQPIVHLLGEPDRMTSSGFCLESGVDAQGEMILTYEKEKVEAVITFSKVVQSYTPSEIVGEDGAILFYRKGENAVTFVDRKTGEQESIPYLSNKPIFYYELDAFLQLLQNGETVSAVSSPKDVGITLRLIDAYRKNLGVVYAAD